MLLGAAALLWEEREALPGRVRLEREDRVLTHCWVRWERKADLSLAGGGERCYQLDPYAGTVTFGDGVHGRVPPPGEENIRVSYCFGGGEWGNRPAGAVSELIGALPRISQVENLTPMSGGTDRFAPEKAEAMGLEELAQRIGAGVPTLRDVAAELMKPGRDIRDELPKPILRTDVLEMKDLKPGMELKGTVRNVIDFGVFVDIGVHQDGLVHISQLNTPRRVSHPSQVCAVGDVVTVWVLDVDEKKKRISLTMKKPKDQTI